MRKNRGKRIIRATFFALMLTAPIYLVVQLTPGDKFNTIDEYWPLVGTFVTYLIFGLLFNKISRQWFSSLPSTVSTPEALETRLYELSEILGDAGRSLKSIEAEISIRESAARRLATRTEQLHSAVEMDEDDAKRVGVFLAQELEKRLREMNRETRKTSWLAFVFGVLVSVPTGIVINILVK